MWFVFILHTYPVTLLCSCTPGKTNIRIVIPHTLFHSWRRHKILAPSKSELRMGLADDVVPAIMQRFPGGEVGRVVDAWERIRSGAVVENEWDDKGSQVATSYIADLYTEPWHDVNRYPWITSALESNASVIREEVQSVCSQESGEPGGEWLLAAGEDSQAYGLGWRKIVLQEDRVWKSANCDLFPRTADIIRAAGVPSVEVFFAKQQANSGVAPHTESTNFYVTAHLALQIPGEDCCRILVGKEKRTWTEGKALAFDPSFVHEMRNDDGTSDQLGLVVKFWHPDITPVERNALQFIFDVLQDPSILNQPFVPADADMLDQETGDSTGFDNELQEELTLDTPLTADVEAARLDGFLAGLKEEGLLPGVSTPDEVMSASVPKNRNERRQASKRGKRQTSAPRKKRKR